MYRSIGVLFVIVILFGIYRGERVSATSEWSNANEVFQIKAAGRLPTVNANDSCPTFRQRVTIVSLGEQEVCVLGGVHGLVVYENSSGTRLAASVAGGEKRYLVRGVCEFALRCLYSPESDSMVEQFYGNYPGKTVFISRAVGENLKLQLDPVTMQFYFQYTAGDTRQQVLDVEGRVIAAEKIGMSQNGKWLAVERYNQGLGIINLYTLAARRITDASYMYGYGRDPSYELAVADDGSAIMATGNNAGFTFMAVNDMCGEVWRQSHGGRFEEGVLSCDVGNVDIGGVTSSRIHRIHKPRFIGSTAMVYVQVSEADIVTTIRQKMTAREVGYIALGDSFTSGEGETDDTRYLSGTNESQEKCHVSVRSYPYLLSWLDAKSVACSGARTQDIAGGAQYKGQSRFNYASSDALTSFIPGRIAQLGFVKAYQPSVVTIGVGGNDIGLMEKVRSCVTTSLCEWARPENREKTALEIRALYPQLVQLYGQMKLAAPAARQYVIGYPDVLRLSDICSGLTGIVLNGEERTYLRNSLLYLNEVIQAAAHASGIQFISLHGAFGDQGLCEGGVNAAMNGIRFGNDGAVFDIFPELRVVGNESFHPTPVGHQLMADAIYRQTGGLLNYSCFECTDTMTAPEPNEYWNVSSRPVRSSLSVMTSKTVSAGQRDIIISLRSSPFSPNTHISVSLIRSNANAKQLVTDANSDISGVIRFNSDVQPGPYTVRLAGVTIDGDLLELYQEIHVDAVETPGRTGYLNQKGTTAAGGVGGHSSRDSAITVSKSLQLPRQIKDIGVEPSRRKAQLNDFIVIIVLVAGATGIIVTCLILVRLLRK